MKVGDQVRFKVTGRDHTIEEIRESHGQTMYVINDPEGEQGLDGGDAILCDRDDLKPP